MGGAGFQPFPHRLHGFKGVTVPELLIGIALIAILAAVAIPVVTGILQGYHLRAAAWQLASDLRLARQKAVSTQQRHRVCFTGCSIPVLSNRYVIEREPTPNTWVLDLRGLPFTAGVSMTANVAAIIFEKKGEVNGSTVTLTNPVGTYEVRTASTGRVLVCKGSC